MFCLASFILKYVPVLCLYLIHLCLVPVPDVFTPCLSTFPLLWSPALLHLHLIILRVYIYFPVPLCSLPVFFMCLLSHLSRQFLACFSSLLILGLFFDLAYLSSHFKASSLSETSVCFFYHNPVFCTIAIGIILHSILSPDLKSSYLCVPPILSCTDTHPNQYPAITVTSIGPSDL